MLCQFHFRESGTAGRWRATCVHCGRTALVRSRRVYAACHATAERLTNEQLAAIVSSGAEPDGWRPVRVGDLVEKALTSVGVTKERVERLTRTAGKPGDCGCDGRKKWLNDRGAEVQRAVRAAVQKMSTFYFAD